jgi:23S rRNA pseudouridine1911/1915/1917 synthase
MPRLERAYADLSKPRTEIAFVVNLPEAGSRLDVLLRAHFPWRSRTRFKRMLETGEVTLDGRAAKGSQRVRDGQRVVVRLPRDPRAPDVEDGSDLVVLHEDDRLLAIDKPSGMTVHPVGRIRHGTLINKLHARYPRTGAPGDVVPRLGHRLDRDTSGVVLVVKDRVVDAAVTELFTRRRVRKTYLALVEGAPGEEEGHVDVAIGRDPEGETILHMRVDAAGQRARTRWRVRERFARHALLELEPLTGRTHQLRVHLAFLGHPILCDHLYGDVRPLWRTDLGLPGASDAPPVLERLALHALRLELQHPVSGASLVLESPLPPDLEATLAALRAATRRPA